MKQLLNEWRQFIKEQDQQYYYHCGKYLQGGHFNFRNMGSGEGLHALGKGIYFSNKENVAKLYCKYSNRAYLYKCSINVDNIYFPRMGTPENLRSNVKKLREKFGGLPSASEAKYGPGIFGKVFAHHSVSDAHAILVGHGIKGLKTVLPNGAEEIAVFDLSIIDIVDGQPVDKAGNPKDDEPWTAD